MWKLRWKSLPLGILKIRNWTKEMMISEPFLTNYAPFISRKVILGASAGIKSY